MRRLWQRKRVPNQAKEPSSSDDFGLWRSIACSQAARLIRRLGTSRRASELRHLTATLAEKLVALPDGFACHSSTFAAQSLLRLMAMQEELDHLSAGRLTFESTETWHRVYQELLESIRTRRYLSVALIKSDDYWQDQPSEHSLRLNAAMVRHGFYVHRVFIIDEFFWPRLSRTPSVRLLHWISEQKHSGLDVSLVRREHLAQEPRLIADFGIYGDEAVGYQETDFEGRTVRYEVRFGAAAVKQAEQHWRELMLYARPWSEFFT